MQDTVARAAFGGLALAVIGTAVDRATLHPWVIETCWSRVAGCAQRTITVVQAPISAPPEAQDLVPDDAEVLRVDVFPATRFNDMRAGVRERYRDHYRAFLLWRVARAHGKTIEQMLPEADASVSERVDRWARPELARSAA